MKIHVHDFIVICILNYLGYIHRSGIDQSYGNSIFDFLRNGQNVFFSAAA